MGTTTLADSGDHSSTTADFFTVLDVKDDLASYQRTLATAFMPMHLESTQRISQPVISIERNLEWRDDQWASTSLNKVLDAPGLRDDFYCSLIAFSQTENCLAVGLGSHIYLWSESRGVNAPASLAKPLNGHITSLSFSSVRGGHGILAISRADGHLTLWSPSDNRPRFETCQPVPIFSVAFSPRQHRRQSAEASRGKVDVELLLAGDEVGHVYMYAVEWPSEVDRKFFDWRGAMSLLVRLTAHTQQICGLAWSPDGAYFASGGNDNAVFLFETKKLLRAARETPKLTTAAIVTVRNRLMTPNGESSARSDAFRAPDQTAVFSLSECIARHRFRIKAACKALAFAPWQRTLVAAGGGSNDRCIHFFDALSGKKLAVIDCHAQVTSLTFSSTRRELAATFGFAQPEHNIRLAVFSWPDCRLRLRVPWVGEERALSAVPYPFVTGDTSVRGVNAGSGGHQGRSEECLVIATSDASIKFHEV